MSGSKAEMHAPTCFIQRFTECYCGHLYCFWWYAPGIEIFTLSTLSLAYEVLLWLIYNFNIFCRDFRTTEVFPLRHRSVPILSLCLEVSYFSGTQLLNGCLISLCFTTGFTKLWCELISKILKVKISCYFKKKK